MLMQFIHGVAFSTAFSILAVPAWADANADANRLFANAMQTWKQANQLKGNSLEKAQKRLELLQDIEVKLNQIVEKHTDSDLAVKLLIGPVGPLSLTSSRAEIDALSGVIQSLTSEATLVAKLEAENSRLSLQIATVEADLSLTRSGADDPEVMQLVSMLRQEVKRLTAALEAERARDKRRDAAVQALRKALFDAEKQAVIHDDDMRSLEERLAAALASRVGLEAISEETRQRLAKALNQKFAAEQQLEEQKAVAEQRFLLLSEARELLAQSEERADLAETRVKLLMELVRRLNAQLADLPQP